MKVKLNGFVLAKHYPAWVENPESIPVTWSEWDLSEGEQKWVLVAKIDVEGVETLRQEQFQKAVATIDAEIEKLRAETEARITALNEGRQRLFSLNWQTA